MTATPKVQRIRAAVERAEAHKALTERALALAAKPIVSSTTAPAIPAYMHQAISATEAKSATQVAPVAPVVPSTPAPKATTTARGSNLQPSALAEAMTALATVPQWRSDEKYAADGRVAGGQWVVLSRTVAGTVASYTFVRD